MSGEARAAADVFLAKVRTGLEETAQSIADLGDTEAILRSYAAVDQFHVGGLDAVRRLLRTTPFDDVHHVVDIGCGTGGPARVLASHVGARVTGYDTNLTAVLAGNEMTGWMGLGDLVALEEGDATALPAAAEMFDCAWCLHVGMFVADKARLYGEAFRVLRPDAWLALYDPIVTGGIDHPYPVPWAASRAENHALSTNEIVGHLRETGFADIDVIDRTDEARAFFAAQCAARETAEADGAPAGLPPLGLHLMVGPSFPQMVANAASATMQGAIGFAEIHARKPQ